ncbi:MAG: lipase maturation factor family protein [Oligoflexia bacterium]|nr:lipase maturation factor family protein [Oligoflexia bacterium]
MPGKGSRLPVLLYDGDCGFCSRWVRRARMRAGKRVLFVPFQTPEVLDRLHVSRASAEGAIQWVGPGGERAEGSDAYFRVLAASAPGLLARGLSIAGRLPPFSLIARRAYRAIARHRDLAGRADRMLFGSATGAPSYRRVNALFLRGVGLVYLIAFTSLRRQLPGLYGSRGLRPMRPFLRQVRGALGRSCYARVPTLFWLGASDRAQLRLCAAGQAVSVLMIAGIAPRASAAFLWAAYLSFVSAGREFLSYQWDALLLETGLNSVFLAPVRRIQGWRTPPVPAYQVLLMKLLSFRLHFGSGLSKLQSGDRHWRRLTALDHHFETQPLPTPASRFFHFLPARARKAATALVLAVECGVPILAFGPRRLRSVSSAILSGFQGAIQLSGNYGFFNLLGALLTLWHSDDEALGAEAREREVAGPVRALGLLLAAPLLFLSFWEILARVRRLPEVPKPLRSLDERAVAFRAVNSYGLFSVMTASRPEIVLEGSDDGRDWRAYRLRYKPGDLRARPRFIAPHQPRLDWQLWFAALGGVPRWFEGLLARLLEGAPEVLAYFRENPFPRVPPRYLRARLQEYRLVRLPRREGRYWERRDRGSYFPAVRLATPGKGGDEGVAV